MEYVDLDDSNADHVGPKHREKLPVELHVDVMTACFVVQVVVWVGMDGHQRIVRRGYWKSG